MKRTIFVLVVILIPIMLFAQTQRWVYRYSPPGNAGCDSAYSIAYGSDGNIYVAGLSFSSAGNSDFTVISLTASGTERWVYRYINPGVREGAYAIAYGPDGNIYACGKIANNDSTYWDFTVASLTPSGTLRWIYYYNGTNDDEDCAYSLCCGADSNIYVCGYVTNGSPTWEDFTVLSLTPSGAERWVHTYDGPGSGFEAANSIVYGLDGNVYVAGSSTNGSTYGNEFTIMSFTSSGTQRWLFRYPWTGNPDVAYAITYGADNNIYAAGEIFGGTGYSYDFTVISVDTAGAYRWIYRYTGPINDWDVAQAITYGSDGNIYAAGTSWNTGTGNDITAVSLTPTGSQNWAYCLTNSTGWDNSYALERIQNGNIYVAGDDGNVTTVNLTSTGSPRWVHAYSGPANGVDGAMSLVFGADGKLYVAGFSEGSSGNTDFVVVSLDTALVGVEEERLTLNASHPTLEIFPNPAKTFFIIQLPLSANRKQIKIFDVTGKEVKEYVSMGVGEMRISLDGIKSGIYFVKVNDNNELKKIIITK